VRLFPAPFLARLGKIYGGVGKKSFLSSKDLKCATQFGESIKFLPQNTFTTASLLLIFSLLRLLDVEK